MEQVSFSTEQFAAATAPSGAPAFLSPALGVRNSRHAQGVGERNGGFFALHEDLVPPGSPGPYPHYHTREDEFWLMTEGELLWIVDGKELSAPKGSFLHLRRGVLHGFENRSGKCARMVVMYTPGKFQEWFIKVGIPTEGASVASFPGPTPKREDYLRTFHWMEVYGLGFTPPAEDGHGEDVQHGES